MSLKLPTPVASSLVLIIVLAASASAAQQKRQTPPRTPQPAATPAPTPPPPTFDTLLAADTYKIYAEVRSVGQLIRSNSVNEILEPILKLAGPPQEFRTVVKWLNTHADEMMSSRLLFAAWSSGNELPDGLVAIEFASPEEAVKFQQQLNGFLQKLIPPPANSTAESDKTQPAPLPPYHMRQAGSLVLITPKPVSLQKLRPAGSKLLSEDVNFRIARNRLNTESIFLFVDYAGIQKEDAERLKRSEELRQKSVAEQAAEPKAAEPEPQTEPEETEPPMPDEPEIVGVETELKAVESSEASTEYQQSATEMLMTLSMVLSSISGVTPTWPAAFGVGLSFEGDSFDVRALLVNAPGEKSDPIPFLPVLTPGPAIAPEAPNILPADTEMFVTLSLDLPQMYALLTKPQPMLASHRPDMNIDEGGEIEPPFAALERQLKIKIKDDLLPLIGPEIVVSVPMSGLDWFQPPKSDPPSVSPAPSPSPSPSSPPSSPENQSNYSMSVTVKDATTDPRSGRSVAIGMSLKDKEGMRTLLPKLIESVAFKGASSLAQTERREDTELVSYANVVSYAFIGNFLVLSPDVATVRHIVDSYLKRETLSGEPHFKNYTRWQPQQLQGQIYISPSLMEGYRTWIQQPTAAVDDQTRAFLTRFSVVAQPVTYSLSNEGFGPMHELHLPKNLVLFIIAASSGATNAAPPQPNPPPTAPPNLPPDRPDNPH